MTTNVNSFPPHNHKISSLKAFGLLMACSIAAPASAATFTVPAGAVEIANDGVCSLIEAIDNANANSNADASSVDPITSGSQRSHTDCPAGDAGQADVIELAAGSYTLVETDNTWFGPTGLPGIFSDIIIRGATDGTTVIERSTAPLALRFRLFYIGSNNLPGPPNGSVMQGQGDLTLERLTLTGGLARGGDGGDSEGHAGGGGAGLGGAIFNAGTLLLKQTTVSGNQAVGGSAGTGSGVQGGAGGGGLGGHGGDVADFNTLSGSAGGGGFGGIGGDGGAFQFSGRGGSGGGGGGFSLGDRGDRGTTTGGSGGGLNGGTANTAGGFGGGGGGGDAAAPFSTNSQPGGDGGFGGGGGGGGANGTGFLGADGGDGGIGGGGGGADGSSNSGTGGDGGFGGGGGGGSFAGAGGFGGGAGRTSFGTAGARSGFGAGVGDSDGAGGGAGLGGAIFGYPGSTTEIQHSTLSSNSTVGGTSNRVISMGQGLGGAVFALDSSVIIEFSTLSDNSAPEGGGAVYSLQLNGSSAMLLLNQSIIANSSNGEVDCIADTLLGNQVSHLGKNLIESSSGCGTAALTVDPALSGLQDNGGGMLTHRPLNCNSAVINAGDAASCPTMNGMDQRRLARPAGNACDLGAIELQSRDTTAPVFTSTAVTTGTQDQAYSYTLAANDPDGACGVSFTSITVPNWLSLTDNNNGSATLSGTPGNDDVGNNSVVVAADDALGARTTQSFTINVANVNDAPSFTSTPIETAQQDESYQYIVQATDPDAGDSLSITASSLPSWLSLVDNNNGTATLSGQPGDAELGRHSVSLTVRDRDNASATQSFTLRVVNNFTDRGTVQRTSTASPDGGGATTAETGRFSIRNSSTNDQQLISITLSVTNPDQLGELVLETPDGLLTASPVLAQNTFTFSPSRPLLSGDSEEFAVSASGPKQAQTSLLWGQSAIANVGGNVAAIAAAPAGLLGGLLSLSVLLIAAIRRRTILTIAAVTLLLTACGGGGQSSPTVGDTASIISLQAINAVNDQNAAVRYTGLPLVVGRINP